MTITITPFDVDDDAQIEAALAVVEAVRARDTPEIPERSVERYALDLRGITDSLRAVRYFARDRAGGVIGMIAMLLPLTSNVHQADMRIWVRPDARRQGVGHTLFNAVVADAQAAGRRVLVANVYEGLPGGIERSDAASRFAAAMGAKPALRSVIRRLAVAETHLDNGPLPEGYALVTWDGMTPDELLPGVAELSSLVMVDAPSGDLDVEQDNPSAEYYREQERLHANAGHRAIGTATRSEATGDVVGYTRMVISPNNTRADQLGTFVHRAHRGHGLGLLMKIANLRRARTAEPRLVEVYTANANENAHMIAINEAMGFRPHHADVIWQLTL